MTTPQICDLDLKLKTAPGRGQRPIFAILQIRTPKRVSLPLSFCGLARASHGVGTKRSVSPVHCRLLRPQERVHYGSHGIHGQVSAGEATQERPRLGQCVRAHSTKEREDSGTAHQGPSARSGMATTPLHSINTCVPCACLTAKIGEVFQK